MKRATMFSHMIRRHAPTVSPILAVLLVPFAVQAQTPPAHDMSTMPSMQSMTQLPKPAAINQTETSGMHDMKDMEGKKDMTDMKGMEGKKDMTDMEGMKGMKGMEGNKDITGMKDMEGMKGMTGMQNGMKMKPMQGGSPPPDARDPDDYADGLPPGPKDEIDDQKQYTQVLFDRFEAFRTKDSHGQALDAQAWTGGDINKLWLKVDGERTGGKLGATRTEVLWNHVYATFWSLQAGVRHDFGDGPGRNWAVIGVQGLAPYWFDVQAAAYAGPSGRTALRLETEYDLRITQRLVLQPNVKVDVYGKRDPDRGIGAGFSSMEAGLRLRYEFTRKVAPYIGVVWDGKFAGTAQYARDAGASAQERRVVAGLRIWY
jgi:copper resistance protein B